MALTKRITERRSAIFERWLEMVINTYPADTAAFLKRQKDQFANPVGMTTRKNLEAVFDELLKAEMDEKALAAHLDPIIRIRAVQAMFSPSQAAGFPHFLKQIIREEFRIDYNDESFLKQLIAFEDRIDEVTLIAFNVYTHCRETILRLKANTERNKIYRAFSRAGLVKDIPDDEPGLDQQ